MPFRLLHVADKLLRYKDIIEVDYTANYIESDALIRVYQGPGGFGFVHYLIEPKRLTFAPLGDRYHADLEAAVRGDPNSASFALDFARLLLELKDYAGVKAAAQPFLADARKWDFLEPAGRACQALGENVQAIAFYKDYLAHFGANLDVLNAVGECYLQAGNAVEALAAWEHSLRIEPNQPKLKERIQELRQKK